MEEKLKAIVDLAGKVTEHCVANDITVIDISICQNKVYQVQLSHFVPGMKYKCSGDYGDHKSYFFEMVVSGVVFVFCVNAYKGETLSEVKKQYGIK